MTLKEKAKFSFANSKLLPIFANKWLLLMKSTSDILLLLKSYKPTARAKYGLTRVGIFGSVARDEQSANSDVDVCYEGKAPSLLTLDRLQADLENLFGTHVDMVRVRDHI